MTEHLSYRSISENEYEFICQLPKDAEELYYMFPKATYPLTIDQLEAAVRSRYDNTVILKNNAIAAFANFYEVVKNNHCSIGNVIVNPAFRNQGIGEYLIQSMEHIARKKYHVPEIHISCFNYNTKGLLLYAKLGYQPYDVEKRIDKDGRAVALLKMKKVVQE